MTAPDSNNKSSADAAGRIPPDLNTLFSALPESEARRLGEVWHLAGPVEPGPHPTAAEIEAALNKLQAAIEHEKGPSPVQQSSPSEHRDDMAQGGRSLKNFDREAPSQAPTSGDSSGSTDEWQSLAPGTSGIDRSPADRSGCGASRSTWPTLAWQACAVLVVLLLLAAAGLYWWKRPVTQTTAVGERLTVTLPDGSAVELNSGSTLRYPRGFATARRVELEGEAFFDVKADKAPFSVTTFNAEVHVTGTRFAVRAWPDVGEGGTTVALASGRVRVAPVAVPTRAVAMAPGETQRVTSRSSGQPVRVVPTALTIDEATAWRHGDLVFKDARLDVIVRDVERRFGVDLTVEPSVLREQRLSLALRQPEDAEAVVRDLAFALGLAYRETAAGFEIHARP